MEVKFELAHNWDFEGKPSAPFVLKATASDGSRTETWQCASQLELFVHLLSVLTWERTEDRHKLPNYKLPSYLWWKDDPTLTKFVTEFILESEPSARKWPVEGLFIAEPKAYNWSVRLFYNYSEATKWLEQAGGGKLHNIQGVDEIEEVATTN